MELALRGLETKTTDPYLAGWRKRVLPTLGHIPVRMITYGAVDRAVTGWIADECSKSTVKNSIAIRPGHGTGRPGRADRPQPGPDHRLAARGRTSRRQSRMVTCATFSWRGSTTYWRPLSSRWCSTA